MKTYSLSDPKERIGGICFAVIMSAAMVALLFALRHDLVIFLMTLLAAVLLIFFLGLYVLNVEELYNPARQELILAGLALQRREK